MSRRPFDPHPSAFYPGSPSAELEADYLRALELYRDEELERDEALEAGCTPAELDAIDREAAHAELVEVVAELDRAALTTTQAERAALLHELELEQGGTP